MKTGLTLLTACSLLTIFSCTKGIESPVATEDGYSMAEIGSIDVGDLGAAEISAFDPISKRLFIVNNSTVCQFLPIQESWRLREKLDNERERCLSVG